MNEQLKKLKSVGCLIDNNGIIYPQHADGSPDTENPMSWDMCSKEFYSALSKDDKLIIESIVTMMAIKPFKSIYDRFIF
jgi:hypothetical protein